MAVDELTITARLLGHQKKYEVFARDTDAPNLIWKFNANKNAAALSRLVVRDQGEIAANTVTYSNVFLEDLDLREGTFKVSTVSGCGSRWCMTEYRKIPESAQRSSYIHQRNKIGNNFRR